MTYEEKSRVEALCHLNAALSALAALNNTGVQLAGYNTADELRRVKAARTDLERRVSRDITRVSVAARVSRPQRMEVGPGE